MAYNLRNQEAKNYKSIEDGVKLPRRARVSVDSKKLYPVSVIEEEDDRVKIHYEGYSDEYDEWRSKTRSLPAF